MLTDLLAGWFVVFGDRFICNPIQRPALLQGRGAGAMGPATGMAVALEADGVAAREAVRPSLGGGGILPCVAPRRCVDH